MSLHKSSTDTTSKNLELEQPDTPVLTLGVIADIQYAPIPDGHSFKGVPRYYRHALLAAKHAAKHFEEEVVSAVVNFGDIIDGKCQEVEENTNSNPGIAAIDSVIAALSTYQHGPMIHTYGNHELYNFDRDIIQQKLNIPFVKESCGALVGYFTHTLSTKSTSPEMKIKLVVLDSYDISILQRSNNSTKQAKATQILQEHNPNYPKKINSPDGLNGVERRFVAFNGAIDVPQLEWLKTTLQEARDAKNEMVIVVSHQPISPESTKPVCLIWNFEEILSILRDYSDVVAASFSGHAHKGGYARDEISGIHFHVFEAMLESNDPIKTYAFVDAYPNKLVVRGFGDCQSGVYDLGHLKLTK